MTQALPQLLSNVGSHRGNHQNQGFDSLTRHRLNGGQVVVEHNQLGDSSVQAHVGVILSYPINSARNQLLGGQVRLIFADHQLAGDLINGVTPQALQETLRTNHRAGFPGAVHVQGSHAHLVNTEGVGAVSLIHVVRGDDVLQALTHLAVFTLNGITVPGEVAFLFLLNLICGHILAALLLVGVGLHITLVEQLVVRLRGRDKAQVKQHLVPKTRVQQVQHRVLHSTDVKVGTTRSVTSFRARTHPVSLVSRVN